ncbi:MAG: protein phosphatase 2C domain-containing protein, partial [Bacteroidales bacterium]|nr:protein phosphatase 2C domain-containing protein [Bacteroidales bacterium]
PALPTPTPVPTAAPALTATPAQAAAATVENQSEGQFQQIVVITPEPSAAFPIDAIPTEAVTAVPMPLPQPAPSPLPWIGLGMVIAGVLLAGALLWRRLKHPQKLTAPVIDEDLGATEPLESAGPALQVGTAQHIGTREEQEDALCCSDFRNPEILYAKGVFAAVADGVGGMSDGQLASTTAARGLLSRFTQQDGAEDGAQRVLRLVAAAHQDVLDMNQSRAQPCGSTLVCALVVGNRLHFASVGDSRILLYRAGGVLQLNREHTLGAEMDVQIGLGQCPAEEIPERRRKAITAFLGKEGLKQIDRNVNPLRLLPGDRVLLMSDGVFGTLSEEEILAAQRWEPADAAAEMVRRVEAHKRTHQDNATVVILGYNGGEDR